MRKARWCSICWIMLLLMPRVFAEEFIDIKVNNFSSTLHSVVLYTHRNEEKETFWVCGFIGLLPEQISKFLDNISGLMVVSTSPIYKPLREACMKYDNLRYANGTDFENDTIYLFDYSPDNEYFQTIIKSLQRLSKCYFDLNLLHSITIR